MAKTEPIYSPEFKRRCGLWLRKAQRGHLSLIADCLEVTPRTLNTWKRTAGASKKLGRPQAEITFKDLMLITREWHEQGRPGFRPIAKALPWIRVRLIQKTIRRLKAKSRKRASRHRTLHQVKMTVHAAGALTVIDAAKANKMQEMIVIRDRRTRQTKTHECESFTTSEEVVKCLIDLKEKDQLPLVLGSDNGSAFCCHKVDTVLRENQVIHLKSLPHTPEHNGACEIAVREVKEQLKNNLTPLEATHLLNERRKRQELGWKTSAQLHALEFTPYTKQDRAMFYEAASSAIGAAQVGIKNALERRKAEREAIMRTLQRFKLATITRGGQPWLVEPEDIT